MLGVHSSMAYLRADVFSDFQAAGPVAIGAALTALAVAHVDQPNGLAELHARAARSSSALYIGPRIAVLTIGTVGLTTAVWDISNCGPMVAITDLSLFTGLALLVTGAVNRTVGGAVPVLWVASLVASAGATGVGAVLWRLPLACDPSIVVTVAGMTMAGVGTVLPPRRGAL